MGKPKFKRVPETTPKIKKYNDKIGEMIDSWYFHKPSWKVHKNPFKKGCKEYRKWDKSVRKDWRQWDRFQDKLEDLIDERKEMRKKALKKAVISLDANLQERLMFASLLSNYTLDFDIHELTAAENPKFNIKWNIKEERYEKTDKKSTICIYEYKKEWL